MTGDFSNAHYQLLTLVFKHFPRSSGEMNKMIFDLFATIYSLCAVIEPAETDKLFRKVIGGRLGIAWRNSNDPSGL
jgi:hypothetical protein